MLEEGKCDTYKHWDGGTVLHLAAKFNKPDIFNELLHSGAGTDYSLLKPHPTVLAGGSGGISILQLACDGCGMCRIS